MSRTASSLPDLHQSVSDALRTLILSQHEQILLKDEQLASRDAEIEQLKLLIAKLRRMQFGASRRRWKGRSSSCSCGWTNWKRAGRAGILCCYA